MVRDQDRRHDDREIHVTSHELRDQNHHDDTGRVITAPPPPAVRGEVHTEHTTTAQTVTTDAVPLADDRVRWGPIWAGLLTALTSLLLLSLLGAAIGLSTIDVGAAARGTLPADAGRNTAIWGALAGIIAFLIGGYVAGWVAAVFDRTWGAFNGAMVFFLAVPATLWLAGLGLGSLLGTLGSLTSGLSVDPGTAQSAAQQAASQVSAADVARTAETVRTAAWGTLLGLSLALGASALGGALGTRREVTGARATGDGRV